VRYWEASSTRRGEGLIGVDCLRARDSAKLGLSSAEPYAGSLNIRLGKMNWGEIGGRDIAAFFFWAASRASEASPFSKGFDPGAA
jgi:hypothetical protein